MTAAGWALEVARDDLTRTSLLEVEVPEPAPARPSSGSTGSG
jgi:hypothetical protein